jgi:hypothetical protein
VPVAAPPPPPSHHETRLGDRNPLRVYHRDRANLAEIPTTTATTEDGPASSRETAAAPTEPAPPPTPPREKNIVEHFFGSIQSVLPERLRQ